MTWHGAGLVGEAPGDAAFAPGPRQLMDKLLIQNQEGDLQQQAGKRKVKEISKPFWSIDKSPLCRERSGEEKRELLGRRQGGSPGLCGPCEHFGRPWSRGNVLLDAHLGKKVCTSLTFSLLFFAWLSGGVRIRERE